MKRIGFLSFGHWRAAPGSQTRSASDALLQSIELAQAAEQFGIDGAFVRVHHFERQLASPFPLLSAMAARTSRIEIGTAVIDLRYENPLYMAEEAAAADLISAGRLQLGISRGSPETALRGAESFGYRPAEGETDADAARAKLELFLAAIGPGRGPDRSGPDRHQRWPGHSAAVARSGRPDLVGLRHPGDRAVGGPDRPEPAELHPAVGRHRCPVRPASGRADPAVPRGLGRAGLEPRARASRFPAAFCPSPRTSTACTSASRATTTRSGCWTACVPGSAARSPVSRTASPRSSRRTRRSVRPTPHTVHRTEPAGRGLQRAHPGHDRRTHRARHRLDAHRDRRRGRTACSRRPAGAVS